MTGGNKLIDRITIQLRSNDGDLWPIYLDVFDTSLGHKWLQALEHLLDNDYHLEKNYCFFGFPDGTRDGSYILDQINRSITAINQADIGYHIDDWFDMSNTMSDDPAHGRDVGRNIIHDKFNWLHRYFEDLQGVSGRTTVYYDRADADTRWHIRQLNLLCHEFESWALSYRKQIEAPDWVCPSQLMCWLNAPRFLLDENDYQHFGIETLDRHTGGIYLGVNKAVGKHHWEVFNDEGRDSRIGELVSTTLRSQTEAAGDFDIEWGRDPSDLPWRKSQIQDFRDWLTDNGFDPKDPALTIGHPQVGQIDLLASFDTENHSDIVACLNNHLDVFGISTSRSQAIYDYRWSDPDFKHRQISILRGGQK